ncbi:hypothetical protein AADU03_004747 [Escherichia coli]
MAGLQPLIVFKAEISRVNELYWSSSYSYDRICKLLDFLRDSGIHGADPQVRDIWGSKVYSLDRVSKTKLSDFSSVLLSDNLEALRTNSILHLCSAFENALSGYFFLCSLYDGKKGDASYTGDDVPVLLSNMANFNARRNYLTGLLDSRNSPLKGKYVQRLKVFNTKWNLALFSGASLTRLNGYYATRHKIAHDQGLGSPDMPEFSAEEILGSRVSLAETKWKVMIHDFQEILEFLDSEVKSRVVKDKGLALAVYRTLHRDGALLTADLISKLAKEWRLGVQRKDRVHRLVLSLGGTVKQVNTNKYEVSL